MEDIKKEIIEWIRDWFSENGPTCKAVIGISGGKDSSICAALCVEALGKDRVLGVLMPNGTQKDYSDSIKLCRHLNIKFLTINIGLAYNTIINQIQTLSSIPISKQTETNLPARLRMSTLYAVSQSVNGRVINTSNLSESVIGWDTRWGDAVGDMSPLGWLTCTEVIELGKLLDLPEDLVLKVPDDGMCGLTDEEKFGFTYKELDDFLLKGEGDPELKDKLMLMITKNSFKRIYLPSYSPIKHDKFDSKIPCSERINPMISDLKK